jgi:hypothetical protein
VAPTPEGTQAETSSESQTEAAQSSGSQQSDSVDGGDAWRTAFEQRIGQLDTKLDEGFGMAEDAANVVADAGANGRIRGTDSTSEESESTSTEVVVEDRQPPPKRAVGRTRVDLRAILHRLLT